MKKIPLTGPLKTVNHSQGHEQGLHIRVAEVLRRAPVTVTPDTSIRTALQTMEQMKIGSVVVACPTTQVPLGIFTLQDVLRRVALPQPDLEAPISAVMSGGPISLGLRSTVHQVALLMARRNLRHVLITDDSNRLVGIISKNDVYDMMCTSCLSARSAQRRTTTGSAAASVSTPAPAPAPALD